MANKLVFSLGLAVALIFAGAATTSAQIIYDSPTAGGISADFTSWSIETADGDKSSIYQIVLPLYGYVPLRDNLEMTVFLANSASFLDLPETDYDLSGFNDASIQVNQSLGQDHYLLSAGVNLPTGKKKLNYQEELVVLQVLTENYLQMPMSRFGEGFGFNLLAGGAAMLGDNVRGGAGITYQYTGSYEPYEDYTDYNPGDIFGVNVGFDVGTDSARAAFDIVYTMYTDDTHGGDKIFRQAPQIDVRVSGFRSNGKVSLSGMLRYLNRGDNKEFDDSTQVELAPLKLYGNEFGAAGAASFRLGEQFFAGPVAEFRNISSSDLQGSASVYGVGGSLTGGGGSVAITGRAMYHIGNADGGDIDLTGYSASLGLTARF